MVYRLMLRLLLRRAKKRQEYWVRELASLSPVDTSDWLFREVSERRANAFHAVRALESVRDMEVMN